jgi:hypothetical protein
VVDCSPHVPDCSTGGCSANLTGHGVSSASLPRKATRLTCLYSVSQLSPETAHIILFTTFYLNFEVLALT